MTQTLPALKKSQEVALRLESFALDGKSVARYGGFVVFVNGGVPGDEVRAVITRVKKQYGEAGVLDVVTPSPLRTAPRCMYFGTCGGCKWQHVSYQAQLEFKRQHVVDTLERIGGFAGVAVNPTRGAENIFFYRNKMEFSFGERWLTKEEYASRKPEGTKRESLALGLHIPQRFDKVLDIQECHLQSEFSNRILNLVREFCTQRQLSSYSTFTHTGFLRNLVIRQSAHTDELMVNIVTSADDAEFMKALTFRLLETYPGITTVVNNITQRKSQVAIGEVERVYHGPGYITERIGKRTYRISANSFFQTNTRQAEILYDTAARMAALQSDDVVFDLYCGTGTIALHVADEVREVVGIESAASAVEDATTNAAANGVRNCTFILGDLKECLTKNREWLNNRRKPTVMIIDPPRAGMHEKVVREVLAMKPARIVYISCNPATQARDLALMCTANGYEITEVQPVDMFPHTSHIENIVSLKSRP